MKMDFLGQEKIVFIIIACFLAFAVETLAETTFGTNIRVDDTGASTSHQREPSIAVDTNGNIYVVWQDYRNGNNDINFAKSTDGGISFGPNVRVDDSGASISHQYTPSIAVDTNRNIYVAWMDDRNGPWDVYFSKSTNGGVSFGPNVRVDDTDSSKLHPSIAVAQNGNIYVVWHDDRESFCDDIYFAKSTNGGASFGQSVRVDNSSGGWQEHPSIAVDTNGNIYVVWHDDRESFCDDIYFAKSTNGGASFGPNVQVDDAPNTQYMPSIAVDTNGNICVAWQDNRNGNYDIYFAKSTNGGASFGPNVRVDDSSVSTSTQWYSSIAVDTNGNIYVVWQDYRNGNNDIYFAESINGGTSFGQNVRVDDTVASTSTQYIPSITVDQNGNIYVAWADNRNGNYDIYFAKGVNKVTLSGAIRYENRIFNETGTGSPNATEFKPVRFADIEIINASDSSVLATGETDINGNYSLEVSTAMNEQIFLHCYACQEDGNYRIIIKDNVANNQVHYTDSEPITLSGDSATINLDITEASNKGGAFNIFDCLAEAVDEVKDLSGATPPLIRVYWQKGTGSGTFYQNNTIYLNGSSDDPDEYDDSVILHEYGHFIAHNFSKDDSLGGSHQAIGHYDIRLSWSEGWATFFPSMLRNNPIYSDTFKNPQTGQYIASTTNIENLLDSGYGSLAPTATGQDNEIAVASVLWDIFDGANEYHDLLSLGINEIWDVFANYLTTAADVSMEDFWDGFNLGHSYQTQMESIFLERSIEFFEDTFEDNNTSILAKIIPIDGTVQHYTYYPVADEDWISFSADAGARYDIETSNLTNFADTVLELYDTDGVTLLGQNDDRGINDLSSSISWTAPSSDTYFVKSKRFAGYKAPILTELGDNLLYPGIGTYGSYDIKITTDAPILEPIGNKSVNENELIQFTISATDRSGDVLTYSSSNLPEGASFNPSTKTFSWTPTYDQAGTYTNVHFEVTDGLHTTSEDITITVTNVNRIPEISSIPNTLNKNEGKTITSAEIELASDTDGDSLSYSYSGWFTSLPYTIKYYEAGNHLLHVDVSDDTDSIGKDIIITVNNVNTAPLLDPVANKSVSENTLLTFTVNAADPDGDSLTYLAFNLPEGANFNSTTKIFTWIPTYSQASTYTNVHFEASDGLLTASENITIIVNNVNRHPVLSRIGNQAVNEGNTISLNISASDPDGDTVSIEGSGLTSFMSFDGTNFRVSPGFTDAGNYQVIFIASDENLSDIETITISVGNVNRPPEFNVISDKSIDENSLLNFTVSATDPDGNIVTYSASNLPQGASFNVTTRTFTWTPTYEQAGAYPNIRFEANDGSLSDLEDITIIVNNVNRAPVLGSISSKSVSENNLLSFTVNATDADGATLFYTASNLPDGASFDNTAKTFTWTPTFDQAETYPNIHFEVTDGLLTDSEDITITVGNTNRPPVLSSIGNKSMDENILLSFTIKATDPDGDSLTYSASNLPQGASFNASTKTFTWTPTYEEAGTYSNVHFEASDGSLTDSEDITLTVSNVNRHPVLSAIGNQALNEGESINLNISASDPDGDSVTIEASGLTSFMSFDGTNFTAAPAFADAGNYPVIFTASDGTLTDTETITISVGNVNLPPEFTVIGNKSIDENSTLSFIINAIDPDGDSLTYSASNLPQGANFSVTTKTFTWTPTYEQADIYTDVHFEVTDGSLIDSEDIIITVNNVNRAPILGAIGNKSVDENDLLSFTVNATDPDEDGLTYSASNLPQGVIFSNTTKTFTWIPTYKQADTYPNLHFEVTDGSLTDSEDITVTVNNTNRPPILGAIGNKTVDENSLLSFTVKATDPDGDSLIYSASNLPQGASFDVASKTFTWTPTYDQAGTYPNIHFEVRDGDLTASEDITITVKDIDITPPVTTDNYDSLWHKEDFTIYLSATDTQSNIKNIYYSVNDGIVYTVKVAGQPIISLEGNNNKLEYWSVDEVNNEELPHNILTGIKLDKTLPSVSITSPDDEDNFIETKITVTGTAVDTLSGIENVEINVGGTIYTSTVGTDGSFSVSDINIVGGPNNIVVKAYDAAGNEAEDSITVFNGWVLHLQIPYYQIGSYYSGAACAQIILNYVRNGVATDLTQEEIYNYAHPYNYSENESILEMDPRAMDYALDHFDPYGNGQGYNFGIGVFESDRFIEYLRNIIHWMDFPVTIDHWSLDGDLVAWPNVPVTLPAYGIYSHWIVVNGASASQDPMPEPHERPWYTPDFTVYGLWLTDPTSNGIGKDIYVTAQSAKETYLLPLSTSDHYNGRFVHVAEPPEEESDAEMEMAEPRINDQTLKAVEIAEDITKEIQENLSPLEERIESAKRHIYDAALVVDLEADPKSTENMLLAEHSSDLLKSVFDLNNQDSIEINWREILDPSLLTDENFRKAFDGSQARTFVKVKRIDRENSFYYLIPFDKYVQGQFLTYAALIINAEEGSFREASWVEEPTRFVQVDKEKALKLLLSEYPKLKNVEINAELVWEPGGFSESAFYPYWRVCLGSEIYIVTQNGEVIKKYEENQYPILKAP